MEKIAIGTRRELFVDDFLIEEREGLELHLHCPERREVALTYDGPCDDQTAGAYRVLEDGDRVRIYYRACLPKPGEEDYKGTAVAESLDGGISFQKPILGLVEWKGSRENNLISLETSPTVPPPFIDENPNCPASERYKGISAVWKKPYIMTSGDGIRWRLLQENPMEMEGTFDTINVAFWDTVKKVYRCYTRYFERITENANEADVLGEKPTVCRAIQSAESSDFIHWSKPVHNEYSDSLAETQLYTNATIPCPGAEHIYLAFPNRYVQERIFKKGHIYPGCNDALFMTSRDGYSWNRFTEAWVRPGLDDLNWTDRNNYPVWGIVETSEKEWSMYISEHYRRENVPSRLRRLSIRPHGFASLRAGHGGGHCLTKSLVMDGEELRVNFSTSAAGFLKVALCDENGSEIDGFGLDAMEPMWGDALDRPVIWKNGKSMAEFSGQPVRIKFYLEDGDLYAFRSVSLG
jgi:hypothetical protein